MPVPGEYVADATEGIVDPNDLPKPKIQQRSRTPQKCRCPDCQHPATRHEIRERKLHHLGDPGSGRPVDVQLQYSVHDCCKCKKYFQVGSKPDFSQRQTTPVDVERRGACQPAFSEDAKNGVSGSHFESYQTSNRPRHVPRLAFTPAWPNHAIAPQRKNNVISPTFMLQSPKITKN